MASNPLAQICILAIRAYQWVIAPILPRSCRFAPSCSEYAAEAIAAHGVAAGLWLAARRILRCHPWGGSGYDPVPAPRHSHGGRNGPCAHPSR
jgi:putative membrane protein insertion efficiency factor